MTQKQIKNVRSMIDGLIYHYNNYKSYSDSLVEYKLGVSSEELDSNRSLVHKMRHEVTAYINRMGQFNTFVKSERIKEIIPNAQENIPTINKYIPFRNKITAHRAIDAPRPNDDLERFAISDDHFHGGAFVVANNNTVILQYSPEPTVVLTFDLLALHPKILEESNRLIDLIAEQIPAEE